MRARISLLIALALAVAFGGGTPSMQSGLSIPQALTDRVAADGEATVIVGVRAGFVPEGFLAGAPAVADQRDAIQLALDDVMGGAAQAGVVLVTRFSTIPIFTARVDAAGMRALAVMPGITSIELNAPEPLQLAQSVPLVNAPAAWSAGATGAGWRVAILDSGVDKAHPFLAGKVLSEACYSNAGGAGIGTSVCPGGVPSSTAVNSGVPCDLSIDGCEHGTHVAGIAAGSLGGASGVAPGAGLVALQVFTRFTGATCAGGSDPCVASYPSDQILALERVLALAGAGNVNQMASANMSLGGNPRVPTPCDAAQASRKAAIDNLRSVGIATVIATGNNSDPTGVSTPACISTAVSVGSTTKSDLMSSFTNRSAGMVSLLAPGSAITSSVPGGVFESFSGTSMATPHVAGAWAVLKHALPGASVTQVLSALQATGTIINDAPSASSYRRINVNAARLMLIGGGSVAPGPPGTPTISGSGNTVQINWTPPVSGGTPTSYTVVARFAPGGAIIATLPVGNALSTTVPAPNGTFFVTVVASNSSGNSPESAGVSFSVPILPALPGAPTNLAVSVVNLTANFSWTPPASGGLTTGYAIVAALSPGGAAIATLPFPAPSNAVQVTNVPPGIYFVRLAATNAAGAGPFSNEVQVVVAPPNAPTMQAPSVAGSTVNLAWTPAAGPVATSFVVVASLSPGGPIIAQLPTAATALTVMSVPPGTYFVRVHAQNGAGTSAASNEVTVVVQ